MRRHIITLNSDREVNELIREDLATTAEDGYVLSFGSTSEEVDALLGRMAGEADTAAIFIVDENAPPSGADAVIGDLRRTFPTSKTVLLTGFLDIESPETATQDANRVLLKPPSATALRTTVRELLEEWEIDNPDVSPSLGDRESLVDYQRLDGIDLCAKVEAFGAFLDDLKDRRFYLNQRPLYGGCEARSLVRDPYTGERREMIMMASNNYLGMTTHPRVVDAARSALTEYGVGSGAVPLLSGTLDLHKKLERRVADFKQGEDCVLFPSGFAANVGIISAMARDSDVVFLDHLVHASIIEGARASGATIRIWRHNDVGDLEKKIRAQAKKTPDAGRLIVVDGVYSMDGDVAPLPEIVEVARRNDALVMVDEAHSTGVLGETGRGIAEHFGLQGEIDLLMGTFSKALGAIGGFCVAKKRIIDYIRHYARSYIFSTSLPPATVAGLIETIDVIEDEPKLVQRAARNADRLRQRLNAAGLDTGGSNSPIVPIVVGDQAKLWRMGREIHDNGVYLNSVFFPAVPRHLCRLRITVMATHSEADVDRAADVVIAAARRYGVLPPAERSRRRTRTGMSPLASVA